MVHTEKLPSGGSISLTPVYVFEEVSVLGFEHNSQMLKNK